jgi:hypothetical protein
MPAASLSSARVLPRAASTDYSPFLAGVHVTACFASHAYVGQLANPDDIIIECSVTPRAPFVPVPRNQDPVAVRATAFPANSFDPTIATLIGDTDLTNAHGLNGVADGGVSGGAGMQSARPSARTSHRAPRSSRQSCSASMRRSRCEVERA